MKYSELEELHYISPIKNVESILNYGILSHNKAKRINHESCALPEIQELRERVKLPNGKPLHDYANLYFHARNPMMYRIKETYEDLTVLAINPRVLYLPNVVITDCNASREMVLFQSSPKGLEMIDKDMVYAESWIHDGDSVKTYDHKGKKCAEVLVPEKIETKYLIKAYASCDKSNDLLVHLLKSTSISVETNGRLFFQ